MTAPRRLPPNSGSFRFKRRRLPDDAFALPAEPEAQIPTDVVASETWASIMHLPYHVALSTSDHRGHDLAEMHYLWGSWINLVGERQDEMFEAMVDATDCLQASTFDMLHGYYRAAIASLRAALEVVAIGTLCNLSPADPDYQRWRKRTEGSLPFNTCFRKLRSMTAAAPLNETLAPNGTLERLHNHLCAFAHARPDASDGKMWQSNGPIFSPAGFDLAFYLYKQTDMAARALVGVARG